MGPRAKRQRLSEDGTEAVTATTDIENSSSTVEAIPNDDVIRKQNLQQRRTLFVRSLAPTVSTDDLTEHFSESYPIKHAVAVLDPTTKQCKGYGFVTFADAEDARRAKAELDGSQLQGKKVRIEIAEPRLRDLDSEVPGHKKSTPSAATLKVKAERQAQRQEQQQSKLIIRNLPWTIKEPDQLAVLFRSYGKVKYADLPKSHTGKLKGFGFVLLRGRKNAEKALDGVNGKEVDGRTLAVDWAVDKETWQNIQSEPGSEATEMQNAEAEATESSEARSSVVSETEEESLDSEGDEGTELGSEGSNTDYENVSDSDDGGVEIDTESSKPKSDANTLFIRNLPFTVDDTTLHDHFTRFGKLRYARVVLDQETQRPRGTGFVSFVNDEDTLSCLRDVPRTKLKQTTTDKKDGTTITVTHSVLEDEDADPGGKYTMDGRILQISRAVDRNEAARLTAEGAASRFSRDKDKRRLYLLSEGTISQGSTLYQQLAPSEVTLREASAKQRQKLIQSNPSLHLSLTRLSVRNIPRSITSKDLKALARQAIVGFAEDVKAGKRQRLSKEELARGGEAMVLAEKLRKKRGLGLVKQAKIVFETPEGSKVAESSGAGRSRGYGFIEYYTHRNALMGLRRLNGHAVDYRVKGELPKGKKAAKDAVEDRKKRLIVEFAIENANVVHRRAGREAQAREQPKTKPENAGNKDTGSTGTRNQAESAKPHGMKRKRNGYEAAKAIETSKLQGSKGTRGQGTGVRADGPRGNSAGGSDAKTDAGTGDAKLAQRSRIIRKKRMARRARKSGKA